MRTKRIDVVSTILALVVVAVIVIAILTLLGPPIGNVFSSCILLPCVDGLTIELDGFQPKQYTVEVSMPFRLTQVFNCPSTNYRSSFGESGCTSTSVFLNGVTPEEVTVRVTWEGGSKTETFRPAYEIYQPNGPQCEPICSVSTVTMTLP